MSKKFSGFLSCVFPPKIYFYGSSTNSTEINYTLFNLSQCFLSIMNFFLLSQVVFSFVFEVKFGKCDILEIPGILECKFAISSHSTSYYNNEIQSILIAFSGKLLLCDSMQEMEIINQL